MKIRIALIATITVGIVGYGVYKSYQTFYSPIVVEEKIPSFSVVAEDAHDYKSVTVRVDSQHRVFARSRVNGTILSIHVSEGDLVKQGDVLLTLIDSKLIPQIEAIDTQIKSAQDQLDLAKTDFERAQSLKVSKVIAQAEFDKKQTALNVAENTLNGLTAQKETLLTQQKEGHVLAPISGKVLTIPVTVGSVMMMGENAVELAGGDFILKLSVPESHAGFLKEKDVIDIFDQQKKKRMGTISKIYPKLQNGQIMADVVVKDIDNLYVDQLLTAHIKTSERKAFFVPDYLVAEKFGLHFVNILNVGRVAVEVGRADKDRIEIISGVQEGDKLLCP